MYRRLPSVAEGAFAPYAQPRWCQDTPVVAPAPWRWAPLPIAAEAHDFVDGLVAYAVSGDPDAHSGMSALLYTATRSMQQRALQNADGEMLIVPQQGLLRIQTELGWLAVEPGEIALIPRGLAFRVEIDGPSRGYVCENHGAALRLPDRQGGAVAGPRRPARRRIGQRPARRVQRVHRDGVDRGRHPWGR